MVTELSINQDEINTTLLLLDSFATKTHFFGKC